MLYLVSEIEFRIKMQQLVGMAVISIKIARNHIVAMDDYGFKCRIRGGKLISK